jgi:hypothetical protein
MYIEREKKKEREESGRESSERRYSSWESGKSKAIESGFCYKQRKEVEQGLNFILSERSHIKVGRVASG